MATPGRTLAHTRQNSAAQTPHPPASQAPTIPPLPPPDTFDFLPSLYALLHRLQQPSGIENPANGSSGAERVASGNGKLELHDLGTAASSIRIKIQKAKAVVKGMPDIDRTVIEQEEEIRALEERIERQRIMLRKLSVTLPVEEERGAK